MDNNTNESKTNRLDGKQIKKKDSVISKAELAKANTKQLEAAKKQLQMTKSTTSVNKTPVRKPVSTTSANKAPVRKPISATSANNASVRKPVSTTSVNKAPVRKPVSTNSANKTPIKTPVSSTSVNKTSVNKEVVNKETTNREAIRNSINNVNKMTATTVEKDKNSKSKKRTKPELEPLDGEGNKITAVGTLNFGVSLLVNSIILLLLIQVFILSYSFGYKIFANISYKPSSTSVVNVEILPDSSSMDIVSTLEESGVIENKWVMLVRIRLGKYSSSLMPGKYELSPSMATDEIIDILCHKTKEE